MTEAMVYRFHHWIAGIIHYSNDVRIYSRGELAQRIRERRPWRIERVR